HPGADDNASGVAALLAAARHLAAHRPQHTMVFAALDAEEQGLQGARALVRSIPDVLSRVALNINLDMVSRNERGEIYAAGSHHYPWTRPILEDIRKRSHVRILFGHDQPKAESGLDDWTMLSDHGAFHEVHVPFVYFGVEDHPDYHKPTDTVERIDPAFFGDVVEMIVEAIRTFDVELVRSAVARR
ncbi:MAG TPA: M20/M25/M40 family metallo-hydrolase, partial [Vicinamibacterales bacterium]